MVVSRVVLKTKTPLFYIYIYIYSLWEIPWVPEVLLAFDATYVHLVKGRLDFPQSRSLVFSFRSQWDGKTWRERSLAARQIYSSRESHSTAHKPTRLRKFSRNSF